ncbi:MAG TPA: AMP-binding protein [Steroidobacteraceae bacterium]|nr:AMP-binding protein [Steroidobacteraceae bacterium]
MDTFAQDRLPPKEQWPRLHFDLPELQYPPRLNCATVLLDEAIAEGHGERPAILTDAGAVSYRELLEQANRIANVLVGLGVEPGNRVLLRGYNGTTLYAAWLAVMKSGAIAVTTMPMLRVPELSAIMNKGRPAFALCDQRLATELREAAAATSEAGTIVTWGDGDLEERMAKAGDRFVNVDTAADDVCLLAFTSGTTGQPKACVHFHRDVLAMADVVARHLLRTQPDDIYAGSPPLGFTFGLGALLVFPLRFRAATVPIEAPSPATILAAIEKHRVTCLFTAPFAYRALSGELTGRDISSLKRCVSAGEFLPKAVSDLWHGKTGIRIIDGIGATEMIHIFISAAGDEIRPGATGKPLPGYQACVLDEKGRPLAVPATGRLAVTGPTGCRYLDDERQRDYVQHGWNVTGDLYRVDEDGYFWFVSRADDMIVSAGYNIAGPEVEWALLAHPAVRECAVIGAQDPERGTVVKACVVPAPGRAADAALVRELQDFVKQRIAPYKYPRVIEFMEALPKTATGKLQRKALRK